MRALYYTDQTAAWALNNLLNALSADLNEADHYLAEVTPANVLADLTMAARKLAEQTSVDLFDDITAGLTLSTFDISERHNAVVYNFHNRMLTALGLIRQVPATWLPACSVAISDGYSQRVHEIAIGSSQGGFA